MSNGLDLGYPTWAFQPSPGWSFWRMVRRLIPRLVIGAVALYGFLWLVALAVG